MKNLTEQATIIAKAVEQFGCISIEQVKCLMAGIYERDIRPTINFLESNKYLRNISNEYLTSYYKNNIDSTMIACLWIALDQLETQDGCIDRIGYESICKYDNICNLFFIKDNVVINIAYISESTLSNVSLLQQRFYAHTNAEKGKESDKSILHLFVTKDKEIPGKINDMQLNIPYCIALISSIYGGEKPDITYIVPD